MHVQNYSILRNSVFNLLGWIFPVIVSFLSVPIILNRLGSDQYGVWTLVMAVMGYFALLDMGVVKGGIKFLADSHAREDYATSNQVVSIGFLFYLIVGVLGGVLIALSVDTLLLRLLDIPDPIRPTARAVFYLASIGFPITMMQTYLLSLPQAAHRFDISNMIDSTNQVLTTAVTVIALLLGFGLISVIVIRIVASVLCCFSLMRAIKKPMPKLKLTYKLDKHLMRQMFAFSMVSFIGRLGATSANQLQPLIVGSILGTTAVTLFSIPFQLVGRVMSISWRLSAVLLPISSELGGCADTQRLHQIYINLSRYHYFLNVTQLVFLSVFSWDILSFWINPDFANKTYLALIMIVIGTYFDTTTNLPSQICDGFGRPGVTSTFSLIRGLVCIVLSFVGGSIAGVNGVAAGYMSAFITLSLFFNYYVHSRVIHLSFLLVVRSSIGSAIFGAVVLALLMPFSLLRIGQQQNIGGVLCEFVLLGIIFCVFGYTKVLDTKERLRVQAQYQLLVAKLASKPNL